MAAFEVTTEGNSGIGAAPLCGGRSHSSDRLGGPGRWVYRLSKPVLARVHAGHYRGRTISRLDTLGPRGRLAGHAGEMAGVGQDRSALQS